MQWIFGMALAAMMATSAMAADAVLRTADEAAYQASLLEMARPLSETEGKALIMDLMTLIVGPRGGRDGATHFIEQGAILAADPTEKLRRLDPYEGKTAAEITALAAEIRKQ